MPKAYWVVTFRPVSDRQKLAYAELALAATAPFGARILRRGNATVVYEDGLKESGIRLGTIIESVYHSFLPSLRYCLTTYSPTAGFARMVERAGVEARLGLASRHSRTMLRHACGYSLAKRGHDTRA
jgi:Domain of unknown function (DUF1330)